MNTNNKTGNPDFSMAELALFSETAALKYAVINGYRMIDKNYTCKVGEIGLILIKRKTLAFCTIRTLRNGQPKGPVTEEERRHIRRVASYYLSQGGRLNKLYHEYDIRFDVIEVNYVGDSFKGAVTHIENAFDGSYPD